MKKYRIDYGDKIQKFEVLRETEKTVFYIKNNREERELKISNWAKWFDTFEEAKIFLTVKYKMEIERAEYRLNEFKQKLEKIQNYTEDEK